MEFILVGLGIVIALVLLWLGINRYLRRHALASRGCPRCRRPLFRSHRKQWQKILSFFFPGLRKYTCQQCGWRGMLIHTSSD